MDREQQKREGKRNDLLMLSYVGKQRYSMIEYEKMRHITFPVDESVLLIVGTKVEVDHNVIINKILQFLDEK